MAATPIVLANGEGDRRWFLGGGTHTWKLRATDTDGAVFAYEDALTLGKMTPLHSHPDTDEAIFVLEGDILANIDGVEHVVGVGGMIYTPRGVPHAFVVRSATARLLSLQTPGTADAFYWQASEPATGDGPGPVDFDRVGQVAQSTRATQILGPPPFPVDQPAVAG
jgi:quercetin dioxygenase-like cupin family protein